MTWSTIGDHLPVLKNKFVEKTNSCSSVFIRVNSLALECDVIVKSSQLVIATETELGVELGIFQDNLIVDEIFVDQVLQPAVEQCDAVGVGSRVKNSGVGLRSFPNTETRRICYYVDVT